MTILQGDMRENEHASARTSFCTWFTKGNNYTPIWNQQAARWIGDHVRKSWEFYVRNVYTYDFFDPEETLL